MVIGVYCKEKKRGVMFEDCIKCAKCLAAPIISSLRIYENKKPRNVYFVGEVVGCLRKAYFERNFPSKDEFLTLNSLISIKRGKLFGGMVSSTKWQELPGSIDYEIDGEKVKLSGRLDVYDPDSFEITEIKSKKIFEDSNLPKGKDVLQLQCYGTIFKRIFQVKKLRIVYFDMDTCRDFSIPFLHKETWLENRVKLLHRAVRDSNPPIDEPSFECKYCSMRKECKQYQPTIQSNPKGGQRFVK